jgi:hypothetical protein
MQSSQNDSRSTVSSANSQRSGMSSGMNHANYSTPQSSESTKRRTLTVNMIQACEVREKRQRLDSAFKNIGSNIIFS